MFTQDSNDAELDKLIEELDKSVEESNPSIIKEKTKGYDLAKKEKAEWDKENTDTDTYEYSDKSQYDKDDDPRKGGDEDW